MERILYSWKIKVSDLDDVKIGVFDSVKDAVEKLNLKNTCNINNCLCGIRDKAQGYRWKWVKVPFESLEGEVWKPVIGYENLYSVSNLGRVISLQYHGREGVKLLSQSNGNYGYKVVKLRNWNEKTEKSLTVHRLVAEAFIPNPDNKPQVDHIDTNPGNNIVDNLRWCTSLENQRNPITLQRISSSITRLNRLVKSKKVSCNGIVYSSLNQASRSTGRSVTYINKQCKDNKNGWHFVL